MKPLDDSGLAIFVPLSAIFPATVPPIDILKSAIDVIDRWKFVLECGQGIWKILTSWDKDVLSIQKDFVSRFFNDATYQRLLAFEKQNGNAHIIVFFRRQFLEAIRWAIALPAPRTPPGDSVPKDTFLKALLACSEVIGQRQTAVFARIMASGNDLESMRRLAAVAFRSGTEIAYASKTPTLPIARSVRIFGDLLPRHMPSFAQHFRQAVGLDHSDFLAAQTIIWALITSRPDRYPVFSVGAGLNPDLSALLRTYLASQSILFEEMIALMPNELSDPAREWSLQPLRAKPLLRQPSGGDLVLIPDPRMLIESITAGPIFSLTDRSRRKEAIDAFGHAIEDYAGEILRNAYPDSTVGIVYRHSITIKAGRETAAQIDGYLSYGHSAIVCEIKASFISDDVVVQQDAELFLKELEIKYVEEPDGSPKAVAQLSRAIRLIQSGMWSGENGDLARVRTVWPVLVVHDEAVDDPMAVHFLSKALQDRLSPGLPTIQTRLKHGRLLVAPLCIVSVDLLELLETSFSEFSFLRLLVDYDRRTPDRMISLHNFLTGSEYSGKLLQNRRLNELVAGLLAEWKARFSVQV